jgi:hypothetical protein
LGTIPSTIVPGKSQAPSGLKKFYELKLFFEKIEKLTFPHWDEFLALVRYNTPLLHHIEIFGYNPTASDGKGEKKLFP